jgi:hypothetical protein
MNMSTADEKSLRREMGRRRVLFYVAVWMAIALTGVVREESDMFLHALDEYGIIAVSIIALVVMIAWRNKRSLADLKKQNNIVIILFVIAVVFKLYAFTVEANDPSDFGDEIPVLIALILVLLNRFV